MNFLQLAQRTASECGISGTLSTTANQTGSLGRIVSWVGDAWNDLQTNHDDWIWMRSSRLLGAGVSFVTVSGQASYPLGTGVGTVGITDDNFDKWVPDSFRCYTTTVGIQDEVYLDLISFDAWRDGYMYGAQQTVKTRPYVVAIGPNQSVCIGPPSNGLYTVTGDYYVGANVMVNDTDLPTGLPSRFHNAIVFGAMLKYSGYESAPEVAARATREYASTMNQLENLRLPQMTFGGPIA